MEEVLPLRYAQGQDDGGYILKRFTELLATSPRCFHNDHYTPGHITGSALITNPARDKVVFTFHRKLKKWLQLGGHADGHHLIHEVALREAQEESGILDLRFVVAEPIGWDIHEIPARGTEPAHLHYDVRYLLQAPDDAQLAISDESDDLRWFSLNDLSVLDLDASVITLVKTLISLRHHPSLLPRGS
jgi:8-oxo-dGTP pyrophosphatase MutT (NUDIX family)